MWVDPTQSHIKYRWVWAGLGGAGQGRVGRPVHFSKFSGVVGRGGRKKWGVTHTMWVDTLDVRGS